MEDTGKDLRGVCWLCPYYSNFQGYCGYYHIYLANPDFEPTCNNLDRLEV